MIYPPIADLLEKIGTKDENGNIIPATRYSLAIIVSKRARELGNDENSALSGDYDEAMLEAIDEINKGKIKAVSRYNYDEEK